MPAAERPPAPTATASSRSYLDDPESLILPDGPVSGEATELLAEFVHPHHHAPEETLVGSSDGEDDDEPDAKARRPWWKRPSPWWLIASMPFTAIAMASTIAPRIEIYTMLVCSVYKPDIFKQSYPGVDASRLDLSAPNLAAVASSPTLIPIYLPELITDPPQSGNKTTLPNQCASDPVVQAEVARLTAVITTTMGILSCITTGWWGSFSDRHGRTRVMGISILGLLANDFVFIAVTTFWKHLPGGYWLLVIGPVAEGVLGGFATGVAAIHGYMADTTSEGRRAQMFSTSLGLMFTGMALGPTLGSLLIRFTGKTISVFYLATTVHLIFTFFVWTVLPESLSEKRRRESKAKYAAEIADMAAEREQNPAIGLLVKSRRLFAFLSPLTIFMPVVEKTPGTNPLKAPKKDWNLTIIALGYASTITLMGSYGVKFQYAASTFHWSSEIIGYWLSLVGAARAIFLAVVLPLSIKLFKSKPVIIEVPRAPTETTPLVGASADSAPGSTTAKATKKKEVHSPAFDLNLARVSLFLDLLSFLGMGLATHSRLFTLFGVLGAFGAGFAPAVQSVALALYSRRGGTEIGRLFGALSVLQALCSQIFGPTLYGLVYMKTVAHYPATIFFVSSGSVAISLVLLGFVRLPALGAARRAEVGDEEEQEEGASPSVGTDAANGTLRARLRTRDETLVDVGEDVRAGASYGTTRPASVHSVHH